MAADGDYRFDLGRFARPASTSSRESQRWFDRGLVWSYAFNHEEAIRCFERAIEADDGFALAHWGVAYAWARTTTNSGRRLTRSTCAARLSGLTLRPIAPWS